MWENAWALHHSGVQAGQKVLDIGGGSGQQLDIARSADKRVAHTQIVDLDKKAKELAEQKGHAFSCGPVEKFNTDQQYDLIIMLNIIEHVQNPTAVLMQAKKLLNDHGRIIVKTPNWKSLDQKFFGSFWTGYHCPRHWTLWNRKGFIDIVNRSELKVVRSWYTQGGTFWAASLLSLLNHLGIIHLDANRPVAWHPLYYPLAGFFAAFDFARLPFSKPSQMLFILRR